MKKVLKNCYICKYIQGKSLNPPKSPPLPKLRIQCDHAFESVGIDYAGPPYCKDVFTKSEDMNKYYILLFTCAVKRAIHLEVTPDVCTRSLILALKRFISRRGIPKLFISDNFKTFKSVELKYMLRNHKVEWNFILEKCPWWGGFYERMIGIVKISLKKVKGKPSLTYDKMSTILTEIENATNSQPLTYVNEKKRRSNIKPYHPIYGRNVNDKCFQIPFGYVLRRENANQQSKQYN